MGLRYQTAPSVRWPIGLVLAERVRRPGEIGQSSIDRWMPRPPHAWQFVKHRAVGSADARIPTTLAP